MGLGHLLVLPRLPNAMWTYWIVKDTQQREIEVVFLPTMTIQIHPLPQRGTQVILGIQDRTYEFEQRQPLEN